MAKFIACTACAEQVHPLAALCPYCDNEQPQRGKLALFLFGLVFLLPVFGIFAAIAIPAYQDYTIRAKVVSGLAEADNAKYLVEQYAYETQHWPVSSEQAGIEPDPSWSMLVDVFVYETGEGILIAEFSEASLTPETQVAFVPYVGEDGAIDWQCRNVNTPEKYLPATCRDLFEQQEQ